MNQEEHNRIVTAGLSKLPKPKDSTDLDRLFGSCETAIQAIRAHARNIGATWREAGKDTTTPAFRKMLLEDLQGKFLDLSCQYGTDEIRLLMAHQWSVMVVKEVV